jgi:hypothetical protein
VFERVGHSMLTPSFLRIQNDGQPAPGGPVSLIAAFQNPSILSSSNELDLFLKGLSVEVQDETDLKLVTGMRLALLDAIDIQRARDHGLPNYNTLRQAYGLNGVISFADITSDLSLRQALASIYPKSTRSTRSSAHWPKTTSPAPASASSSPPACASSSNSSGTPTASGTNAIATSPPLNSISSTTPASPTSS